MPKMKTTKKFIRENYQTIINVDYCNLQFLLRYEHPFGYTHGIYGWQCDFYDVNGICICTGYDTMATKKNPGPSYELTRKYDDLARSLLNNNQHVVLKAKLDELLKEFIEEALKEMKNGNKK